MKDLYIKALIGIMLMLVSGNAWGATTTKETHKVFFSVNGTIQNAEGTEVQEDAAIPFPTENPEEIYGKKFVGWCGSSEYTNATTPPQYVASATMGNADITYYAVFATISNATLTKITAIDQIVNGTYAIIRNDEAYYLPNDISIGVCPRAKEVKKNGDVIDFVEDMKWKLAIDNNKKIKIESAANKNDFLWGKSNNDTRVANNITTENPTKDWYAFSSQDYGIVLYCKPASKSNNQYLTTSTSGEIKWKCNEQSSTSKRANLYKINESITYSNFCTTVPSTATITLNAACHDTNGRVYGTFSHPSAWVVPEGLSVAEIGVQNGMLNVHNYNTGAIVPKNTGVMVSAAEGGDYTVNLSNEAGTSVPGASNCLRPSGDAGITANGMASANTNCTFYRLTMHNGLQIGFWWGAENGGAFALAANKAYLAVPNSAQVKAQCLWRSDEETGIVDVTEDDEIDETANESRIVFDLSGRRLDKVSPFGGKKGFYIINGKKVIK